MNELRVEDVSLGDTLIIARNPRWTDDWTLKECTVVKVLKTQLVIADRRGRETRVIVRGGRVTGVVHGTSGGWSEQHIDLYRTDDALIPKLREKADRSQKRRRVRRANEDFRSHLDSAEFAEELHAALGEWIGVLKHHTNEGDG